MSADELTPNARRRLLDLAAPLLDGDDEPAGDGLDASLDGDRYERLRELGQGGMGVVWEARDRWLDRRVALKVPTRAANLSSDARARFVREAHAAARLSHPSIAAIHDASPEAIAMQLVDGETLDVFAARADSDVRTVVALLRDAALAIHYAHGEGVVHRDLKPANLMVERGERPHVFVMDFGLAKELSVDGSLSLSGHVLGTPSFMAPEQAAGRMGDTGPRTDVYGLGATLYAALAGEAPFTGDDVLEVLRRVGEQPAPSLRGVVSGVDADLALIVSTCLEKDPEQRYASALALAGDLERWLEGAPITARPPSLAYRLRRYVSRRRAVFAAAGLVLVLAAPFLVQAWWQRSLAEQQRAVAEEVLSLSESVNAALRDARASLAAGVGHELSAHPVIQAALDRCEVFLARHDVPAVHASVGRLLAARGDHAGALLAYDRADEGGAVLQELKLERGLSLAALYREGVPLLGGEVPLDHETWRARGLADLDAALLAERIPTAQRVFAEGQRAWLAGDLDDAIMTLREAVEMDPSHTGAHLSLSTIYLLTDRVDLGMRHSIMAVDLMSGNRPAYLTSALVWSPAGELMRPGLEVLELPDLDELVLDVHGLYQQKPDDAHTYGMRGQVQLRSALRARAQGQHGEADDALRQAVVEFTQALVVRPDLQPAQVDRAVCHALLARWCAEDGDVLEAAAFQDEALRDYDAVLDADDSLVIARFDRSLLHERRAQLAMLAMRPAVAQAARDAARDDAREAVERSSEADSWRPRLVEHARGLGLEILD